MTFKYLKRKIRNKGEWLMRLGKYLSSLTKPELDELKEQLNLSDDELLVFLSKHAYMQHIPFVLLLPLVKMCRIYHIYDTFYLKIIYLSIIEAISSTILSESIISFVSISSPLSVIFTIMLTNFRYFTLYVLYPPVYCAFANT